MWPNSLQEVEAWGELSQQGLYVNYVIMYYWEKYSKYLCCLLVCYNHLTQSQPVLRMQIYKCFYVNALLSE